MPRTYELAFTAAGMTEPPEATYITVSDPVTAKRIFASELLVTGEALGDPGWMRDAELAATDVLDHDIDACPFGLHLGQWSCTLVPKDE